MRSAKSRGRLSVGIHSTLLLLIVLGLIHTSDLAPEDYLKRRLSEQTAGKRFDFYSWEWSALLAKMGFELAAPQDTLDEGQRHALVKDYLERLDRAGRLRWEIASLYSQLGGEEPTLEILRSEQELEEVRAWLQVRQGAVEGILEEQVSAELEGEGFGRWGYVWPPVKLRFTELPLLLVVSSRSAITREADVDLEAGLLLTDQVELEAAVDSTFGDMRSLVMPIGGLSAYPAMILESNSLVWLSDTFAHEWAHHFLMFYPLGYNYGKSGEITSINETTASIVGREVGRRVVLRYYPELLERLPPLPVPPDSPPMSAGEMVWPEEPPPEQFDFSREMRKTRLRVDALLAAGEVGEAETYMEQRRLMFVERGHNIRKLNQAYFAFHGSYATSPSTANPIGGQLEWLRAQSSTLRDFLHTVARFGRHDDLLAALDPH